MLISRLATLMILPVLGACLATVGAAQGAKSDPALRITLESSYHQWREAMANQDLAKWEKTTAFSRQRETRNQIVSRRLAFPQALFDDPIGAPSLEGMVSLGVLSTGETATSTYYGKANFGDGNAGGVSDNLLVLHFLKEEGSWRFDNLRVVKMGNNAELLLQIRNSDFSFLNGIEFQPMPQLPPIPQPVSPPEYLAEAWIDSTGYEVTVTVNGHLTGKFLNAKVTELVIGGLKKGQNSIRIQTKRLENTSGKTPKVEVAIYAAKDPESPANRVYHYRPGDEVQPAISATFSVD